MIILDTHTLVWMVASPEKLSRKARNVIEKETKKKAVLVSSISMWEICMLVQKRRLRFNIEPDVWLQRVESLPFLKFVPVDNRIAELSVNLPGTLHSDPADRMIIATAIENGATLVTSDKRILKYPRVRSIW